MARLRPEIAAEHGAEPAHAAASATGVAMFKALATIACSVMLAALQHPHDAAVIEDQHAVAAADQLVIVGAVEQDRGTGVGELAQQAVELLLGADVDAAGRVVEQDHARPGQQPLADHHLLLVAAG